jgi:hypothetical protein
MAKNDESVFYEADDAQLFETDRHQQNAASLLTEEEKEEIRIEIQKTDEEINTLRQVLATRQKHVAELKRKIGISPWTDITSDINQSLRAVRESPAYQKTSGVVASTTDTVKTKFNDMRNSSVFKSFESKLGSAYTNAKIVASTSIDHLAGAARGGHSNDDGGGTTPSQSTPSNGENKSSLS